ncbi:hypothetical protein ES703_80109 [subsurface metagenome]
MNWKNVLLLISADVKSYRLVRGERFRRFRENRFVTYALYVGGCFLGMAIGWFVGNFYSGMGDPQLRGLLLQVAINFFLSLPTLALLYGLVITQIGQIQRIGVKASIQPLYWFPITWKEHTLASILANILGLPLAITIFISSVIAVVSLFVGVVPLALLTIFALLVSVLLASATTEASRVLQVRLSGAVTKVAGRVAIWVRFLGSIVFFIVFYAAYFSLYRQATPLALLELIAGGQRMLWFIPYVWPGIALSYFASGLGFETAILFLASIGFLYAIFLAAVRLNSRFGLYEAPAIRVSLGEYAPRAGVLEKLGFSPLEAAVMRKDFKALTRRRELMYVFMLPIMLVIMPFITVINKVPEFYSFLFVWLTIIPGALMASSLGSWMVGIEGDSVWYLYSSPITARSLVKAKYSFAVLFSLAITLVGSIIGGLLAAPSMGIAAIALTEALFLIFSLGMVSLSFGIRGADFRELPRPRMIRPKWAIINMIVGTLLTLAIVFPFVIYAVKFFLETVQAPLYAMVPISGVIASVVAYAFYRIALKNAEEFLIRAEG